MYDDWKQSEEYSHIERYIEQRAKVNEIERLELSVRDISYNFQPFLDSTFALTAALKVPGRKAKNTYE